MKWNRKNIIKGIVTTIIGIALIGAGGFLIYQAIVSQSWESIASLLVEGISLMGSGAYLLGVDDPRLPRKRLPFILILSLALSSCVTQKKCLDKFGELKPMAITLYDTITIADTVYVEPDSLQGAINVDSLLQGRVDSLVHISSSQKLTVKLWYDKYTKLLRYTAEVKPDTIYLIKEIPVKVTGDCPPVIVVDPEKNMSKLQILWRRFEQVSAWLMLFGFIVILIVTIFRITK